MICYSCNRRIGTTWVEVCPHCGNSQVAEQNLAARAQLDRGFAALEASGINIETMADEIVAQRGLKRARPTKRGRALPAALAARKIASRGTSQ